jgi:hypothetical protein
LEGLEDFLAVQSSRGLGIDPKIFAGLYLARVALPG